MAVRVGAVLPLHDRHVIGCGGRRHHGRMVAGRGRPVTRQVMDARWRLLVVVLLLLVDVVLLIVIACSCCRVDSARRVHHLVNADHVSCLAKWAQLNHSIMLTARPLLLDYSL